MSSRLPTPLQVVAVFAIIAVMAAIFFPVFAKSKRQGIHGSCASNEKQLGLGLLQYAQDNDQMMPNISDKRSAITWRSVLFPYIKAKGVYQCPSRDSDDHDANPVGEDELAQNYAANYTGDGKSQSDTGQGAFAGPGAKPVALTDVPSPPDLITLIEVAYNPFPQYNIDDARGFSPASRRFWAGHQGGSNYLFFDGHVKWKRPQDTNEETNGRGVKNLWYRDSTQPLSANGVAVLQDAQERFAP